MMHLFAPFLERAGVVVFDGALATELERRGARLTSHLWSAQLIDEDPEAIIRVHLDALAAGADVISSSSYQASRLGFAQLGLSSTAADERLTKSVVLAREAVARFGARERLVAASLGPYGAALADGSEFTGDYRLTVNELVAFHRPRVEAALAAKPDLILFETLPSLAEAKAVDLLAEAFPHVPFMASFSAKPGSLCSGESFAEAVGLLEPKDNVVAVGLNCSAPAVIGPLLQSVRPRRLLLGASPNSGETWSAIERRWVGAASRVDDFGVLARQYVEAGARIVGGCCRTTPEDIARIRHAFPSRTQPKQ